jgi:F-type H+-transporting ATPase subunit b
MIIYSRIQRALLAAVLALMVAPSVLHAGLLQAQESQTSPESKPASPEAANKEATSKEKEAESDPARNSAAVKYIARKTGLSIDQAYWLCIGLNFAIVFVSIAVFLKKKLPGAFRSRGETIQKGIAEARKASEDARRRLAEVEGRLSRLDSDIAQMRREAEDNAKAEEQRILAAGEEERRRIVTSAEQEIAMAANSARRELKSYAAELAVDLAEKKIRVGKDTDETLVRKFTAQLGKDGN